MRSGPVTALCMLWLLNLACTPAPFSTRDLGLDQAAADRGADAAALMVVSMDRSFGPEGELPTHLALGGDDRVLALTDRALYWLDRHGRVRSRRALHRADSGAAPVVHAARWDGTGLGLTLRWPGSAPAAATYLALADDQGRFDAAKMTRLAPASATARAAFDGQAHQVLWSAPTAQGVALHLTGAARVGAATDRVLVKDLPPGTTAGDLVTPAAGQVAVCTTDPAGSATLRRFSASKAQQPVVLRPPGRQTTGRCRLASSGRSQLAVFSVAALPAQQVDWGVAHPDLGLGTATYPVPLAQLVDPAGVTLPSALRLSTAPGTVRVEDLLWDGQRYLVLLNTVGYRGGRLVLVALDEAGRLQSSDTIPLAAYEPGRLVAARLAAARPGNYLLLYSTRRPWDSGVLHLARVEYRP